MSDFLLLLVLTSQISGPQSSGERWIDEEARARGTEAVLEVVPDGTSAKEFARFIVDEEGLIPMPGPLGHYNTELPSFGLFAVVSGQGPNIRVYYRTGKAEFDQEFVCIVRERSFGISDMGWRASRWCAIGIGVEWPESPNAPVINQFPK